MATAPDPFEVLTAQYLEGASTLDEIAQLAELLRGSAALRARFEGLCAVEGLLKSHFTPNEAAAAFLRRVVSALPAGVHGEATVKGVMRRIQPKAVPMRARSWMRYIALGAAAVLVLAVGLWAFNHFRKQPPSESVAVGPEKPGAVNAVTIASLEGPVFIVHEGKRAEAKPGDTLLKDDTVETEGPGRASVAFPGGSALDVSCAGTTARMQLLTEAAASGAGFEILLSDGIAEGEVKRGAGHGPLVIRSAAAAARVTGTRLRFAACAGSSRLEVYAGTVDFTRLADKRSVKVGANEYADAAPDLELVAKATSGRDPALWPFDARSPWNHPIGSRATYIAHTSPILNLNGGALTQCAEYAYPVSLASGNDPITSIVRTSTGKEVFKIRVPASAEPEPGLNSLIVVDPEHRFAYELMNAARQSDGSFKSSFPFRCDLRGFGVFSQTGGGRVFGGSALGGLIRKGELSAGIPHALAISIAHKALNANGPNGKPYVWPACDAMSNASTRYGNAGNVYMGSLLAIPADVKIEDLGVGKSGPAYEVAKALQDYGAYVVESFTQSRQSVFFFAEPDCRNELPSDLDANLGKVIKALLVVTNSGPQSIGGGGLPRRPLAPAFKDFSK